MKLTTLVVAFACLNTVTANPPSTVLVANNLLLKRVLRYTWHPTKAHLVWSPEDAYEGRARRKRKWERACDAVLTRTGCNAGTIHPPRMQSIRNGRETSYINVEGSSSTDMKMAKKMRVFLDGSAEHLDDWPEKDSKAMERAKRKRTNPQPQKDLKTHLSWHPPDTYKNQRKKKSEWEHRCDEALTREGCSVGIIHQGEAGAIRNGQQTSYMNVEGAPSMELMSNPKKMHVFKDGSSEVLTDWSERDWKSMTDGRRRTKKDDPEDQRDQKALLFWEPANVYKTQREKKAFWFNRCDVALAREGCDGGTIYKGERKLTNSKGDEVSYVNVQAAPPLGMEHGKKMRVFQDGSSEVVDKWSARDHRLIQDSTRPRQQDNRIKGQKYMARVKDGEQPISDHPEHSISWDPPNAYARYRRLKKAFEKACLEALKREGCDYGIIHKGHHTQENVDGTRSDYLIVAAGNQKDSDADAKRYMRLFGDGSSVWYPTGPLPQKDSRGVNRRLSLPYQRERGRPRKYLRTAQEQRVVTSAQAPAQEQTQDNSKRRRIGGDEYQYPETQAESRGRSQAPGVDGGGGLDLNFPPAEVESPERSHASSGGE